MTLKVRIKKNQKSNYHQRNLARHFWFIFRKIIKIFWYTNSQFNSCFPAKQIVSLCILNKQSYKICFHQHIMRPKNLSSELISIQHYYISVLFEYNTITTATLKHDQLSFSIQQSKIRKKNRYMN